MQAAVAYTTLLFYAYKCIHGMLTHDLHDYYLVNCLIDILQMCRTFMIFFLHDYCLCLYGYGVYIHEYNANDM